MGSIQTLSSTGQLQRVKQLSQKPTFNQADFHKLVSNKDFSKDLLDKKLIHQPFPMQLNKRGELVPRKPHIPKINAKRTRTLNRFLPSHLASYRLMNNKVNSVTDLNSLERKGLYSMLRRLREMKASSHDRVTDATYSTLLVQQNENAALNFIVGANVDPKIDDFNKATREHRRCSEAEAHKLLTGKKPPKLILLLRQDYGFKVLISPKLVPCNFCATEFLTDEFIKNGGKLGVVTENPKTFDAAGKFLASGNEPGTVVLPGREGAFYMKLFEPEMIDDLLIEGGPNDAGLIRLGDLKKLKANKKVS